MEKELNEPGIVMEIDDRNARYGVSYKGEISSFTESQLTHRYPHEFYDLMARKVLTAAEGGKTWLVAGFSGQVSDDGKLVGPVGSFPSLSDNPADLQEEIAKADPAVGRIFGEGFKFICVDRGLLAAQAAADHVGEFKYEKVAALVVDKSVEARIVQRDEYYHNVYRPDINPAEVGLIPASGDPEDTMESKVSHTALKNRLDCDPRLVTTDENPVWRTVGFETGRAAATLGFVGGAELVVISGDVGAGTSDKYGPYLERTINSIRKFGNSVQKSLLPEVVPIPSGNSRVFNLYGAEGVVRDFSTRDSANALGIGFGVE